MTIQPSPLTEHSSYSILQRAADLATGALALESLGDGQLHSLERAVLVCSVARNTYETTESYLAPISAVTTIENAATRLADNVTAFSSTRNPSHIEAIDQACDEILNAIARFHSTGTETDFSSLTGAADRYRATFDQIATALRDRLAAIERDASATAEKLNQISALMSEERGRLSSLTADFQNQFSQAQEARVKDSAEIRTSQMQTFTAMLGEQEQALQLNQQKLEEAIGRSEERYREEANELRSGYVLRAEEVLAEISQHAQEVKRLVGVIGDDGVRSGYVRTANLLRTQTWLWQGVTVGAFGALIVLGIWQLHLIGTQGTVLSWPVIGTKAFVALSIGALAAYAATQAERAASGERANRKLALELAAIGPYLSLLPQAEQDKFRLSVGDRYFGHLETETPVKHSATILSKLAKDKDLHALLTDLIAAIRGK